MCKSCKERQVSCKGLCKKCYERTRRRNGTLIARAERNAANRRYAANRLLLEPLYRYTRFLKYKYGITYETYLQLLESQNFQCALCKTTAPGPNQKFFCVDHCHKTGKIRGLLCVYCNMGLGNFRDNKNALIRAVAYLS